MTKEKTDPASFIKWIDDMTNIIAQHGITRVLSSIFTLTIAICMLTIVINPKFIYEKFIEFHKKAEIENREFRKDADMKVRAELSDMLYWLDADRVSIFEFHNGRKNPSSLGFYYAEMTYEQTKRDVASISNQYKAVNLSLLNISSVLYKDCHWHGSTKQLAEIDPSIAKAIEENGTYYIGLNLLQVEQELGLLIVSFKEQPDWDEVDRYLKRSCAKISGFLNYKEK